MNLLMNVANNYLKKNCKTINDLGYDVTNSVDMNKKELIEKTKILIIDDDELELQETLRGIGFHVTYKKDIDVLSEVEDYPIIICDNKGVGLKFHSKYEGLHLIKLIKEKYPEKIIYLLTAADINAQANDYLHYFDEMVYKGDEEKLVNYIQQDTLKLYNPKDRWNKYKEILRNNGVSELEIINLEDLYVRSLKTKKDMLSTNNSFIKINANMNMNIKFDVHIGLINL